MATSWTNTLFGLFLNLYGTAIILLLWKVWTRRNRHMLKFRNSLFLSISTLSGLLMVTMICLREPNPDHFPCHWYLWICLAFIGGFFTPYILQCMRLNFIHRWNLHYRNKQSDSVRSEDAGKEDTHAAFYYKASWLTERRSLFVMFILVYLLLMVAGWAISSYVVHIDHTGWYEGSDSPQVEMPANSAVEASNDAAITVVEQHSNVSTAVQQQQRNVLQIRAAVTSENGTAGERFETLPGCRFGITFVPFAGIAAIYMCFFVISLYMLRGISDDFGMRDEIRQCFITWIVCISIFFVCNLWQPLFWINEYFPTSLWIVLMILLTNLYSLVIPLFLTYTDVDQKVVSALVTNAGSNFSTLEEILSEPLARRVFNEFLIDQPTTDGGVIPQDLLRCYEDIESYRLASADERRRRVAQIRDEYMINGADRSIYALVPDAVRERILQAIQNGNRSNTYPEGLYNDLMFSVMESMRSRYLAVFKRTTNHSVLCSKFTRPSAVIAGMQHMGMLSKSVSDNVD